MPGRQIGAGHRAVLRVDLGGVGARMDDAGVDACLALAARGGCEVMDINGRPPELHPRFRELAILARALKVRVICRCSLMTLGSDGLVDLAERLAEHQVDLVAALPWAARDAGHPSVAMALEAVKRLRRAGYQDGAGARPRLYLVRTQVSEEGDGLLARLQDAAAAADPSVVLGMPCRTALTLAP